MIAAIQAGGRSSRMGTDKALLVMNNRLLIEHALHAAQPVAAQLQIVINQAQPNFSHYEKLAAQWQAELLPDAHDFCGPLGGIATVLKKCATDESVLTLACDLPFVTTEFLRLLQKIYTTENCDLTVPVDAQERPQMLCAIYAARCHAEIGALLTANNLRARLLCDRVATRFVREAEYAHLSGAENFLRNINTPQEYEAIASQR